MGDRKGAAEQALMARYEALGTCFDSRIPLGSVAADTCPDPLLVEFEDLGRLTDLAVGHRMQDGVALLDFRPEAVVRVTTTTITLFIRSDADDVEMGWFVKGVGAGVACQLRGHTVFHAGAWSGGDGAVAVMGDSGVGKSSISAAAMVAGRAFVTDDVLCLDRTPSLSVLRSFGELRLAPATLEVLGLEGQRHGSVHRDDRGRMAWALDAASEGGSFPLRACYVIRPAAEWSVEAMSPRDATAQLVRHTFAGRLLRSPGAMRRQFEEVTRIADELPIRWLSRGPLDRITDVVDIVERDLAAISAR